jgi:GTP cyclohydrolase III
VIVDSIAAEITSLDEELGRVHETAKQDADKQSASGSLKKLSVNDLKEQRTSVRNIETVPQYNQIDHLTGRTPMERFTVNAAYSVKDAITLFEKVKAKYASLLSFFGEDDNMASNEFFGTMNRFIVAFDIAAEQVRRDEIVKVSVPSGSSLFCFVETNMSITCTPCCLKGEKQAAMGDQFEEIAEGLFCRECRT